MIAASGASGKGFFYIFVVMAMFLFNKLQTNKKDTLIQIN